MKTQLYPPYWKQFSDYIRFERAENKCEKCGVPNRTFVERGKYGNQPIWFDINTGLTVNADTGKELGFFRSYEVDLKRMVGIVLTVAHLDREKDGICKCEKETGRKCANPNHVKAMCQKCHLVYDKEKHRKNRIKPQTVKEVYCN